MRHLTILDHFFADSPHRGLMCSGSSCVLPVAELRVRLQRLRDELPALLTIQVATLQVQGERKRALAQWVAGVGAAIVLVLPAPALCHSKALGLTCVG